MPLPKLSAGSVDGATAVLEARVPRVSPARRSVTHSRSPARRASATAAQGRLPNLQGSQHQHLPRVSSCAESTVSTAAAAHSQCMREPMKSVMIARKAQSQPQAPIPETDQQVRQRVERHLGMLQELCAANSAKYNSAPGDNFDLSKLPPQAMAQVVPSASSQCPKEPVTLFHSARVPPVTLQALLASVCHRRTWCSFTAAEVAVTLFLQYCENSSLPCTELMMHRLYVACVLVAAKALQDYVPSNPAMSKASGLSVDEVCRLELALLRALDWRAIPTPEQMARTVIVLERGPVTSVGKAVSPESVCTAAVSPDIGHMEPPEDDSKSAWCPDSANASYASLPAGYVPPEALTASCMNASTSSAMH